MERRAVRVYAPGKAPPAHVRDAVDFTMGNLTASLSLDDIAAAGGVRENASIGVQGEFPLELDEFRPSAPPQAGNREILDPRGNTTTVSDVAMNSGFRHLSRFSSSYRKSFGEYPFERLHRRQRDAARRSRAASPTRTIDIISTKG